jgi:hypothetical protein
MFPEERGEGRSRERGENWEGRCQFEGNWQSGNGVQHQAQLQVKEERKEREDVEKGLGSSWVGLRGHYPSQRPRRREGLSGEKMEAGSPIT